MSNHLAAALTAVVLCGCGGTLGFTEDDASTDTLPDDTTDTSPDSWWDYPDAIIPALSPTFHPGDCPGGGAEASDCLCD